MSEKEVANQIIDTINDEISNSPFILYECKDWETITTNVGYVYEWFEKISRNIEKRYGY